MIDAYTEKDDPDAKVILGRIMLSNYQICCLRDDGEYPLTSKQMKIMEKFKGKKLSKFPPGWDAFIRPDKVWEFVMEEPCPPMIRDNFQFKFHATNPVNAIPPIIKEISLFF